MSPSSTRSTRMVLAAGAKVCGARLGFRHGDHCRTIADPGQPHCSGHLNAYARIAEVEADIRRTTQTELDQYRAADYHRLKALLDNAAALARTWWFDNGVRAISTHLREEVLSSGPCVYCGDTAPSEIDHIVPVSRGGLSEWYNLAPACFLCNREKFDLPVNVWRESRIRQGLPWPPEPKGVRLNRGVADLLDGDEPPEECADLWKVAREVAPKDQSSGFTGDPRWQAARSAYLNTESGLVRWRVAVEVMFRIETEYAKEADLS